MLEEYPSGSESEPVPPPTKAPSRKRKAATKLSEAASHLACLSRDYFEDSETEGPEELAEKFAGYIQRLEAALAKAKSSGGAPAAKQKTRADLETAAEKIRRAAVSGITKQMTWKPTCKTNTAKWLYDGLCTDPDVFGILMGLDGPPTWKMKKLPKETFENLLGGISASARYDDLSITGTDVNVRYKPDSGEFKFSGTYGRGY
ncbi:hypothetical protein V8E53_005454 [Lactarius tabidus]